MSLKRGRRQLQDDKEEEENSSTLMEYSFDIKNIINKQKRLEFILQQSIMNGTVTDYDTIKYKEVSYKVGQYMELHDAQKIHPYVVQLKRIVKLPPAIQRVPFLQVEWCLHKGDLPKAIVEEFSEHMSDAEVFPSPKSLFCVYVESIKRKCFVLTYEEYTELTSSYEFYYFSRATFDEESETVLPPPESWKKECWCNKPVNPDLMYVQCEQCRRWFHEACIGQIDMDSTFVCQICLPK